MLIYFVLINCLGVSIFAWDKYAAIHKKGRVSEKFLHFLELVGGVFLILPTLYVIRHKNRKFSYYIVSYLILIVWLVLLYLLKTHTEIPNC